MPRQRTTTHGYQMYRTQGCKCDICKAAVAAKNKKYRKPRIKPKQPKVMLDPTPLVNWIDRQDAHRFINTQAMRRMREGTLDVFQADYWCIKLGIHPAEIFGSAFYAGITEELETV